MKFSGIIIGLFTAFTFINVSCQKELFFDNSVGTLLDSAGICNPSVLSGVYRADSVLGSGNYVDVQVNVTTPGSYIIKSDTINGFSFRANGTFQNSGGSTVRLAGSGMPLQPGAYVFTLDYCNTFCSVLVNVLPSVTPLAQIILGGAPGGCTGVIVGSYTAAVAMNAGNIVVQDVTINSTGPYLVTTDTVNGVYFSASGTFPSTGSTTLNLVGSGIPVNQGPFTYTVHAGISTCVFTITYATAPVAGDYFPLTTNSFWTYDSDVTTPDTLSKVTSGSVSVGGNSYTQFLIGAGAIGTNNLGPANFRKSGTDYFQYFSVDSFATVGFDNAVTGEITFLKEAVNVGTTWESAEFSGTVSSVPTKIKYVFTLESSGGTRLVNGVVYSNVKKVTWHAAVNSNNTSYVNDTDIESYYALGIGLIEFNITNAGNPTWLFSEKLRNYQVY